MARFKIGDKLFHPVYGTGTLIEIKEHSENGEDGPYLVIDLTAHDGRFMIPLERAEEIGVRRLMEDGNRPPLAKLFGGRPRELSDNHLKRRQEIDKRLADGRFAEIGRLIRDLAWRQFRSGLNAYERRALIRAKGLLAQEVAACEDVHMDEATERVRLALDERVSRMEARN